MLRLNMSKKEEILKKIRECAKELGGKTPGESTFYEYAEIGIYDLRKLGWPNYGTLVREAKLTPNKFDNTKYNHKQLCNLFIQTIRENNKWPTRAYLDVKHFNNQDFPDSATLYRNLGRTKDLAQNIIDYIGNKKGYQDIITICSLIQKEYKDKGQSHADNLTEKGFVYLGLQAGKYKIGFTKDINRRREDITLLGPAPMVWVHIIETDDMKGVEKYWHNRFSSKQLRGEWYRLSASDVKAFKRWKKII